MEGSWRYAEPHKGNISALKTVQVRENDVREPNFRGFDG